MNRPPYRALVKRSVSPSGGSLLHLVRDDAEASLCGLARVSLGTASRFDEQIFELYPVLRDLAQAGQTLPSSFFKGNTNLDINHPLVAKGDYGTFIPEQYD